MKHSDALRYRSGAARKGVLVAAWGLAALLSSFAGARAQGTLSALETDVDQIARYGRPSVVSVFAQSTVLQSLRRGMALRQRVHTRIGSGVAVEEDLVITTASVAMNAERLFVRTTNGLQAEAELVGADPISNLAVIRVSGIRLPPLAFSTKEAPNAGEWVMAIGTSNYRAEITQSVGAIANRLREPRLSMLQLTNSVYPGYSGGAVLNARGHLIGIVQGELGAQRAGDAVSDAYSGSGQASLVMPVEIVRPVYDALLKEGRVRHGYLAVTTRAASVESRTEPGLTVPIGALVEGVQPDGPAARVGLAKGDLIVAFDNERVEYPEQLARWVAATRPGISVELVWVRDEIQKRGRAVLTESPDAVPRWVQPPAAAVQEAPSGTRIADLEREIQRLNRELERLKVEGPHR